MKKIPIAQIAGILIAAAACQKKAPAPHTPPSLSAPDKALPSAGLSSTPPYIKPEAEATASNGPIQLTFRLYKKTVKYVKLDTSLWGQLELKNVGKKKFLITDDIFYEPGPVNDISQGRVGVYVEILDSHGKTVRIARPFFMDVDEDAIKPNPHTAPQEIAETKKAESLVAGWRRQGLSYREINDKLLDYSRSQPDWRETEKWDRRIKDSNSDLLPERSTTTAAWAHSHSLVLGAPPGEAIGQFTELAYYELRPGHYRIHAIYDHAPTERMKKMKIYHPFESDVRVETPYIPFEVVQ